ncbi:FAD-dependent oxidoreductase [Mycolicibacterium sp. P9-22]|uniref:flavin monoamine oxidase family protein n=1 Tax=Mycolicibacterium sp. P9-22 TaxID=2024613 RepID=UPI0011EFB7E8|nr:FAD-dependent oxidoreductase [Mycolicibacterium sp. P9-22]KAA0112533.1 FAD-binding protein [Mycolicibacterium sp. P9-22]
MPGRSEVVVIGAGLSGLAAATALVDAGVDAVTVLEASPRVGGRTLNGSAGSITIDQGATLVYPQHRRALRLAGRFGVETFDSGGAGRFVAYLNGATHSFPIGSTRGAKLLTAPIPRPIVRAALALLARRTELPLPATDLADLLHALRGLDTLAATVPRAEPWSAPGALELDQQSIGAWIDDMVPTRQGRLLLEPLFGYFPRTTSLLFVLHFLNTWGGISSLLSSMSTTGVLRFTSGAQTLSLGMADALGHRVIPDSPVTAIEHTADGVTVHAGAASFEAEHAIVAISPAACRPIEFRPGLPARTASLHEAWHPVHGRKVNAVYERPFWRDAGLSGSALTDHEAAPGVLDASPQDGSAGILACYTADDVDGDESPQAQTQRKEAVFGVYASAFGAEALHPQQYSEKRWRDEPFHFGCEGGLSVGALTSARSLLKTPVGRIHWAGVETADEWMGFMEGAVQSGFRAAREVIEPPLAAR